ncbi:MAG TPA: undecaprenyl-diphosphate phosphatase [Pyrinomonadaceae bacterium]|jgi:undecaprenyl-diphosphatase
MSILQAIILGIVQGLTEFIPISSTAHLIFASRAMNLNLSAENKTAVIAVIQLGTLIAVLIYFARDIWNILIAFLRDHLALVRNRGAAERTRLSDEARLGWLVIIGSIPIGTIGLLLKKFIEGPFTKNLWPISIMMIAVALLLWLAERVGRQERGMDRLGIKDALVVGCAQVLALLPGASRSGTTIMGGLFAGEKRETAARFSFLLSIPAIFASGLLELKEAFHNLPPHSFVPLALATIVSGIVGYASIWFLLRFLRTHSTSIFIGYRLLVGLTLLVLLFLGSLKPQEQTAPAAFSQSAEQQRASLASPRAGSDHQLH